MGKRNYHKIINFLGLKIKVFDDKKFRKYVEQKIELDSLHEFNYITEKTLSYRDKILMLSNRFYDLVGYYPNLKNPKSFNEKINWLKLNYYNPEETRAIDKYKFKEYIREKLGEGYTIPLIKMYKDINDIDWNELPNKFVIKTNWNGSGKGVYIIKDKNKADLDSIKRELSEFLLSWQGIYHECYCRGYKEIEPCIIVEEYIEQLNGKLYDYKFHCFHGEPKVVLGISERKNGNYKVAFMSPEWEPLKLHRGKKSQVAILKKPKNYEKMLELAKTLSKDFPFVRVDMYDLGDKVYIGELTFTPKGGFGKYDPIEWDYKMGDWLDLNKLPKEFVHIMPEVTNKQNN